jgi:hypothetical protein
VGAEEIGLTQRMLSVLPQGGTGEG